MSLSAMRSYLRTRSTVDLHDDWNLAAIGGLNLLHIGWWCGALSSPAALAALFYCDGAYLIADSCWLLFVPGCVAPRNRATLLVHHLLVCSILPIAAGKPVLMRHLLRTWSVEVHSWNHIATRRLPAPLDEWTRRINKPLFVLLRLIGFPLTWLVYARDRAALPALVQLAHAPLRMHIPLSGAHALMYGLMLKWGAGLLCGGGAPPPSIDNKPAESRA